jgi:hypothetical protein
MISSEVNLNPTVMRIKKIMKSMKLVSSTVAAGLVLLMGAGPVLASSGASERVPNEGGQVTRHAGNFVASDDQQVCYEIDQLEGVNFPTDTDLRGFKIALVTTHHISWSCARNKPFPA